MNSCFLLLSRIPVTVRHNVVAEVPRYVVMWGVRADNGYLGFSQVDRELHLCLCLREERDRKRERDRGFPNPLRGFGIEFKALNPFQAFSNPVPGFPNPLPLFVIDNTNFT